MYLLHPKQTADFKEIILEKVAIYLTHGGLQSASVSASHLLADLRGVSQIADGQGLFFGQEWTTNMQNVYCGHTCARYMWSVIPQ